MIFFAQFTVVIGEYGDKIVVSFVCNLLFYDSKSLRLRPLHCVLLTINNDHFMY